MKKLLIAIVAAGLLGGSALVLADGPGEGTSGYHKVGDRDESPLERKILRARHPDHRDHGHHHHRKHHGKWEQDKHWHRKHWHKKHWPKKHHRHGWHRGPGYRHGYYHGHRRYGHHYYPGGLYFGIADGHRGVMIWNR